MDVVGMNRGVTGAAEYQVIHHLKTTKEEWYSTSNTQAMKIADDLHFIYKI